MKTTNLPIYNVAVSAETEPKKFIEYAGTVALAYDDAKYIAQAANAYPKLVQALRETSNRLRGAAHDARQGVSQRSGNPIEVYSERADAYEQQAHEADSILRELGETA